MKDTQIIKRICGVVYIVALILMIGLVGGMENDAISIKAFTIAEAIAIILMFASYTCSNKMDDIEERRRTSSSKNTSKT